MYITFHFFSALSGECLTDSVESICESSVCQSEACPAFPDAKCIVDDCGECSARWFLNGKELTKEQCSKLW